MNLLFDSSLTKGYKNNSQIVRVLTEEWVQIPESGKIYFIKNQQYEDKKTILNNWSKTLFLRDSKAEQKGWLIDIMMCIDRIGRADFSLSDMYNFVPFLKLKYPDNGHIEAKIRQQLQALRDKGFLEFTGRGNYKCL